MIRLSALVLLAGCAASTTTPPYAIADYNGASVTIRSLNAAEGHPEIAAEANRLCATDGRVASYASTTSSGVVDPMLSGVIGLPVYALDHLFICQGPG